METRTQHALELVREGKYLAEVPIELIEMEGDWSPSISTDDARKLEAVRLALRGDNIGDAAKHGRVFELVPLLR
jgi:hypothetical protein